MYQVRFKVKGIAPLLFNAWTKEAIDKLRSGVTGGKMSAQEREEEALKKVYCNGNGLYMPGDNFDACLVVGTKKAALKRGRASLAPFIQAAVFCEDREMPLGVDKPDGIHEVVGRRPPRTGGAVLIRRPILNEWSFGGTLMVADDNIDKGQVRDALNAAGLVAGLCDWRPKYGRFLVEEFETVVETT